MLEADTVTYSLLGWEDRDSSGDRYIDRCAKRLAKTEAVNHGNDIEDDAMDGAAAAPPGISAVLWFLGNNSLHLLEFHHVYKASTLHS